MDQSLCLRVPEGTVRPKAYLVFELAIAGHFTATQLSSPVFRGKDSCTPNRLSARVGVDVPPLDVPDVSGFTPFRIVPDTYFDKPAEVPV
jgi:hypothetical protein